jgi:hypothetical protein
MKHFNRLLLTTQLFAGLGLLVTLSTSDARAQGYEPASSLMWPLYAADPNLSGGKNGGPGQTSPRPAIGNMMGEAQIYVMSVPFLHSGDDIRGVQNDPVFAVADGFIWLKANFNSLVNNESDLCVNSSICRFYVAGTDHRYIYYYSHVRLDPAAPNYTAAFHAKIVSASAVAPVGGTFPTLTFSEATRIQKGEFLTGIADFADWNHLHFGIVDATQNFDAINPLTAFIPEADGVRLLDDERPTISSVQFFKDDTSTEVTPSGTCRELTNAGKLDITAQIKDSHYSTDPVPSGLSGDFATVGLYHAEYRVERVGSGSSTPVTWYTFDRAPLRCPGASRGLACPTRPASEDAALQQFLDHSLRADDGALNLGSLASDFYTGALFNTTLSKSDAYKVTGGEKNFYTVTNSWGLPGFWDASAQADGLYRVTVEASDQAGNGVADSQLVFVNNTGSSAQSFRDVYIRDNAVETGALPSTLGGQPFWTSPDIVITQNGTPLPEARVLAGQTYQVFVDVHNPTCADVHGVSVRLFTANPSMIVNQADWRDFTGGFSGSVDVPALQTVRLGPFAFTPTTDESSQNGGHRCMLGLINSAEDPVRLGVEQAPLDNNIAQLNLQVDAVSFSIRNPEPQPAQQKMQFACNRFPINTAGAVAELRVKNHPALQAAWANASGATVTVVGSELRVHYTQCNVTLPPVNLPGGTLLPASMQLELPTGKTGTFTVDLSQFSSGNLVGGMSFRVEREDPPEVPK